jgi:glycosyltransferase involved in cell wall biosynthesis
LPVTGGDTLLRIAILFAYFISRRSGSEERVLQIAKGLADQGAEVTLSGVVNPGEGVQGLSKLKVIAIPNSLLGLSIFFTWIVKLLANGLTKKYDVVQIECFSSPRSLVLFFLLRPFSRKFVIVFHDKWFKQDPRRNVIGRMQLFTQRILLTVFNASITPGLSVKKWFEELHGELVHNKMVVIPNGVPLLEIKENIDPMHLRETYGLKSDTFVALFFGLMTFKPNYEAALRLYDISNSISSEFEKISGRKLIFIVAGIGSKNLPRTKCFIPLGFVEKFDDLLSLPDIIVLPHPSSYSGPHVKAMYSFLSRKPVVATENAVKDLPHVFPRKHFMPFNIDEPDTLLKAITDLYYTKKLREDIALNAYQYARKYSWEYVSSLHLKLYEKICNSL